mgnify:FL=1
MHFQTGELYHIFNQGNNREKIFFSRENYLFFLTKIKAHILPHADVLAWCLMPNHFHLMIYVHTVEVARIENTDARSLTSATHTMTSSHRMSSSNANHLPLKQQKLQSINQSIAILLRSYTRDINEEESRMGSVFRPHTKAECLTTPQGITPSFFNTVFGTRINVRIPEKEYPQACFNYIHQNPIQAKLAKLPEDWEFSSYPDYCGARAGKLINRKRAEELGIKYLLIR